MKIIHLITRLDPGGSAENTLLTCHHLVEQGWQASLASGPGWTGEHAKVGDAQVPVRTIGAMRRDPSPVADLRALWQIYRLLRRERPTILHTHSAKAGILGRWAGFMARTPVMVHTPHGHVLYGYARGVKNWVYLTAEKITAPITNRLVALSEGERNESAAAGIGAPDRWVIIPSGVDVEALPPRHDAAGDNAVIIGCVARLEHVKGVDVLVRAAEKLAAMTLPEYEIRIWGDGRQHDELHRLANRLDVGAELEFVGTGEGVVDFLRRLDLYVQPSRNEGMGRALVLAQGVGLATVASNVCGIPDVVLDGRTGTLVEPESPAALANAIATLVRDANQRADFGNTARAWIMKNDETGHPKFSTAAMLWRLEHLYRELGAGERGVNGT